MTKQEALKAIEDSWSALIVGAPWMSDALKVAKEALRETETDGDLISRQAAIDAPEKFIKDCNPEHFVGHQKFIEYMDNAEIGSFGNWQFANGFNMGLTAAEVAIKDLPSAQPTLYGYKIEHLAYIAKVMQEEGVTAEYAVRTFDDFSRIVRMIIEEAQQKVEEALNGWFNQQAGGGRLVGKRMGWNDNKFVQGD